MTKPMRDEHRLVLTAALPPSPERDERLARLVSTRDLDWPIVERAAIDWGLAPLSGRGLASLAAGGLGSPESATLVERCRLIERLTAVRNTLIVHHAAAAANLATALDRPIVALKGADLMQTVYPGLGCRVTADLDLLAREADIEPIETALAEAGWRAEAAGAEWFDRHLHHGHPWTSPDGAVTMELHWALVRPDDPFSFDAAALVDRRRPLTAARGGTAVRDSTTLTRLDAIDGALFLAAHAVRHLDAPEGAYRSLVDLAWFLSAEPALDVDTLAARATAQRLDRVMAAAIGWLGELAPGTGGTAVHAIARKLLPQLERDEAVHEMRAMMTDLAHRPAHRPLAVASGITGCWQRSGRARWAFLFRGLAPSPGDMERDLAPDQRRRRLPLRYLALVGNYWNEAWRLGPGGFRMAARLGRIRRRLSEG